MNALIRGDKRKAVKNFKPLLGQATGGAQMQYSQQGFMNQLKRETGGEVGRRGAGPLFQNIPSAQAQMFGSQKPKTDEIARNLIGQQLADAAFDAEMTDCLAPIFSVSAKGFQFYRRSLRVKLIEFFFAARTG